mgnify:CR=1 FL=1
MSDKSVLVVQARKIFEMKPREAALALIPLKASTRAMVLGKAFRLKLEGADPRHANDAKEKAGRQLEDVIACIGDEKETIHEMIEAGDTDLVLAMLAGNAGDISSTADVLDAELIEEFFDKDADMNSRFQSERDARIVNVCWTLIKETKPDTKGVNEFFLKTDMGLALTRELEILAGFGDTRDENIDQILQALRDRQQFVVETAAESGDHETEAAVKENVMLSNASDVEGAEDESSEESSDSNDNESESGPADEELTVLSGYQAFKEEVK